MYAAVVFTMVTVHVILTLQQTLPVLLRCPWRATGLQCLFTVQTEVSVMILFLVFFHTAAGKLKEKLVPCRRVVCNLLPVSL